MKLLRNRLYHLLQAVFPLLAIRHKWDTLNELLILTYICRRAGIKFTIYFNRKYLSIRQMKKLVLVAECLATYPEHFNYILFDSKNIPVKYLPSLLETPKPTISISTTPEKAAQAVIEKYWEEVCV